MKNTIVSFFCDSETTNSYYTNWASKFEKNLKDLNTSFVIKHIEQKDYKNACLNKPAFILETLTAFKEPIIWIDIDTEIKSLFTHFDNCSEDIGLTTLNKNSLNPNGHIIYCNFTPNAVAFLKTWKNACREITEKKEKDLDHDVLRYEVLRNYNKQLNLLLINSEGDEFLNGKYAVAHNSPIKEKTELFEAIGNKNSTRILCSYPNNINLKII